MSRRSTAGRLWAPLLLFATMLDPRAASAQAPPESVLLEGTVRDANGDPVAGARVVCLDSGDATTTDAQGGFALRVPKGDVRLRVTHASRGPLTASVDASGPRSGLELVLPAARFRDNVVVRAVRAEPWVPVTKTDVTKDDIDRINYGQEVPFLLKQTPSINQYSDTGTTAGYSYLYLRGVQQTRLNLTLDGVPLQESEDSALYYVDFGDFASSLESIQVQRGVGTSSVGSASYAGSINFASLDPRDERELQGDFGLGSFGRGRGSAAFHSGRVGPGLAFYGRATYQEVDGFRDHSSVNQRSAFFAASHRGADSFFKLFAFAGRERTQLAFLAVDEPTLLENPRENPLSPAEIDRFGQEFVQAQWTKSLGASTSLSTQAYYNGAGGFYRLWADPGVETTLLQYGLDWRLVGGLLNLSHKRGRLTLLAGAHANDFASTHGQDVVETDVRNYTNHGHKNELSAFAKAGFDASRWHVWADAQVRHARFRYEGDQPLGSVEWTFFNPKVGLRRDLRAAWSAYVSAGRTTREPARSDLFAGEDNPTLPYDLEGVRPERVWDFEAGVEHRGARLDLQANAYAMEFRDEIALTGELSAIGLPLRRNVDRSRRHGIELEATFKPRAELRLFANANLSRNRIRAWTQFIDVYGDDGSFLASEPRVYRDVRPLLSPALLANAGADWAEGDRWSLGLAGRYVDDAQLDNTGEKRLRTKAFFNLDATASIGLGRWVRSGRPRLRVQVANLLNHRRQWPSGYSYLFITRTASGDTRGGTAYYYPLATRSVFVGLDVRF